MLGARIEINKPEIAIPTQPLLCSKSKSGKAEFTKQTLVIKTDFCKGILKFPFE
jgi:hypothetical protein